MKKARACNTFDRHRKQVLPSPLLIPLGCLGMYLNRWVQSAKEWCAGRQRARMSGRAWGHCGSHLFNYGSHTDRRLSSDLLIHPSSPPPTPQHTLFCTYSLFCSFPVFQLRLHFVCSCSNSVCVPLIQNVENKKRLNDHKREAVLCHLVVLELIPPAPRAQTTPTRHQTPRPLLLRAASANNVTTILPYLIYSDSLN